MMEDSQRTRPQGLSGAGAYHRNTLERGIDNSSPRTEDKSTHTHNRPVLIWGGGCAIEKELKKRMVSLSWRRSKCRCYATVTRNAGVDIPSLTSSVRLSGVRVCVTCLEEPFLTIISEGLPGPSLFNDVTTFQPWICVCLGLLLWVQLMRVLLLLPFHCIFYF